MTETEQKIHDVVEAKACFIAKRANDWTTFKQIVAAWHDDEMRKLKERCADAGKRWYWEKGTSSDSSLCAAIRAVDAPPKPKSPFGCECWDRQTTCLWTRPSSDGCQYHISADYTHCPFCGNARVKKEQA